MVSYSRKSVTLRNVAVLRGGTQPGSGKALII